MVLLSEDIVNQASADIYKKIDKATGQVFYSDCAKGNKYSLIIETGSSEKNNNVNIEEMELERLKLAESGNADAQYALGCSFSNDNEQALKWFKKAAEQGHSEAQYSLGEIYKDDQNYKQALEWHLKAAAQGNPSSENSLGDMYALGHGVTQNYKQAFSWYQKAAAQGNPSSQYNLGLMYEHGNGVPKNVAKALEWYQKSAAKDYASEAIETWECKPTSYGDWSNIIVTASINEIRNGGEIKVAGTSYQAVFYNAGFDRRWDFGLTSKNNSSYSLVINPAGLGLYYDFSNSKDGKASPKMFIYCHQRQINRE